MGCGLEVGEVFIAAAGLDDFIGLDNGLWTATLNTAESARHRSGMEVELEWCDCLFLTKEIYLSQTQ